MNKLQSYKEESTKSAWESDLKVIEKMKVIVPLKLLLVCNSIVAKLDGEEFSIVTNIESRTSDTLTLSEQYYIPKQRVTSGSIDYLTDDYSHSVVIHRHPNGLNTFSKTDHEFINQNFELSLLYTAEDYFVNGLFNLKHEDAIIPIPVRPVIDYGIEEIDITNIDPIYTRPTATLETNTRKPDFEDFLYTYEDIFNEINEINFKIEALEAELQQYKLTDSIT